MTMTPEKRHESLAQRVPCLGHVEDFVRYVSERRPSKNSVRTEVIRRAKLLAELYDEGVSTYDDLLMGAFSDRPEEQAELAKLADKYGRDTGVPCHTLNVNGQPWVARNKGSTYLEELRGMIREVIARKEEMSPEELEDREIRYYDYLREKADIRNRAGRD